ncbi:MAG: hypothetical protein HUJ52_03420, partial [Malacoplasma sp.]|nr:hypothetical protein [Malacoplasma sp.]
MKKLKSLKTLTTLGAITAITPIIAAACNDKDSNPTQKIDISLLNWSSDGDYDSAMTTVKFIDQFKLNNPAGQNGLPADIYDNVEFDVSGSLNAWTITLTAKEDSTNCIGTISIDITAKINVVSLHWISTGEYNINMDENDIITTFKQNNPAGQHGLPEDVYNNVDVTNDSEFKWVINIKAKDKSKAYIGTESISISVCGNITYNGVVYELPDNIDVNCFCGTGEWNIPTKDNGNLTIQYHTGIT